MPLIFYPNNILKQRAASVEVFDGGRVLDKIAEVMISIIKSDNTPGVGLAAPQIGMLLRMIVVKPVNTEPEVMINPEISNLSGEFSMKEGCLSHPGIYIKIKRAKSFDLTFQDLRGTKHSEHVETSDQNIRGTIIQHECEHLIGKTILDHASPAQLSLLDKKLAALRKEARKWQK